MGNRAGSTPAPGTKASEESGAFSISFFHEKLGALFVPSQFISELKLVFSFFNSKVPFGDIMVRSSPKIIHKLHLF